MPPPALFTPLIKDVIQELLVGNESDKHDNFGPIANIIVSSREGLSAFLEYAQQHVKYVILGSEKFVIQFKHGQLRSKHFPLGLLKEIAPLVARLAIGDIKHEDLIKYFTNVKKVITCVIIRNASWCHLVKSGVKILRAPINVIAAINESSEPLNTSLKLVKIYAPISSESERSKAVSYLKKLFSNFRIQCKTLKIDCGFDLEGVFDILCPSFTNTIKIVETLEIHCLLCDIHHIYTLKFILEALRRKFPNLKKAKIAITNDVKRDFRLSKIADYVKYLKEAEISYEVSVQYTSGLICEKSAYGPVTRSLTKNGFTMTEEVGATEVWVYENEIAEKKNLELVYTVKCSG